MKRRDFVTAIGLLATWPLLAHAQSDRVWRIGYLGSGHASDFANRVEAFRTGLRELGYAEGHNVFIEFRWAERRDQFVHTGGRAGTRRSVAELLVGVTTKALSGSGSARASTQKSKLVP